MPADDLRIGIDVGGTNTDAVVLDAEHRLLAKVKAATSADVTGGVRAALDALLVAPEVHRARERITHLMLGTTHATNAVLERRRLLRVAVLRIAAPDTLAIRPLLAWPADLQAAVSAGEAIVGGGHEVDGRELAELDEEAIRRFLDSVAGRAEAVAITGCFAPARPEHERRAAELVETVLGPSVRVSLSHEIGSLGLIERENATVLNAALAAVAAEVAQAVESALAGHGISPAVLFAQNDGTLMALDYAVQNPVLTIGSGLANSLRGAAFLSDVTDGLVIDVGGTSTDIGVLVHGFPRESSAAVEIGGIRTNFRMPDLISIALGGGSILGRDDAGALTVGPRSVGYELPVRGRSFGGEVATATDAAVAAGRVVLGTRAPALDGLDPSAVLARIDAMIADAVDRAKTSRAELPVVAVGGGSFLIPDALPGASVVHRPPHYEVANAIGAAIAEVSGSIEEVARMGADRAGQLEAARERAKLAAIRAGADPERVRIAEVEEIPLAYVDEPTARLRVKAVGPLSGV